MPVKAPLPVKILNYLDASQKALYSILKKDGDICSLGDRLKYNGDEAPGAANYQEEAFQLYHTVRYGYAYSYLYKQMFLGLLDQYKHYRQFLHDNPDHTIRVTSFGCGACLDYWGLARALSVKGLANRIDYVGIDLATWKKQVLPRHKPLGNGQREQFDEVRTIEGDLMKLDMTANYGEIPAKRLFEADIYVFPMSISEMPLDALRAVFRDAPISVDAPKPGCFFIATSMRENDRSYNNRKKDLDALMAIAEEIERSGKAIPVGDIHLYSEEKEGDPTRYISEADPVDFADEGDADRHKFPKWMDYFSSKSFRDIYCAKARAGECEDAEAKGCPDKFYSPIKKTKYTNYAIQEYGAQ